MQFEFLGTTINISDGRRNYMEILSYYKALADSAASAFTADYEKAFSLTLFSSSYCEKLGKKYGKDELTDFFKPYVQEARKHLASYGVYDLPEKNLWDAITSKWNGVSRLQQEFEEYMMAIVNASSEEVTDKDFAPKMRAAFESGHFLPFLKNDIMALCDYILEYLSDNRIVEIDFLYKDDVSKAEAIFKNLLDSNIPDAEQQRLSCSLIELDPRCYLYYEHIFCKLPQARYEIAAIAQFLSIDLSALIEKELRREFNLKSISNEADALEMMENLKSEMGRFGVATSSRKTELEKILHDYDVAAKTYDGILFETRELRSQAEEDDRILWELHGNVADLNEADCNTYLSRITQEAHVSAIKSKHLQLLQERIHTIWDAEDFERFTELYLQTPLADTKQIADNCTLIDSTGRTESKELFINALCLFTEANVETAAKYAASKDGGLFASIANIGRKETYEALTLNGRVIHPAILNAMEATKSKKGNGIFGFGKSKSKPKQTQTTVSAKFCSNCGTKLDDMSKFCSNCGHKLI